MSNEEFKSSMQGAVTEILARAYENMNAVALLVERTAKINCPVDQGPLRAAMFTDVTMENGQIVGRVGNTMEYAPYVHQGTGIYAVNGDGRKTPWGYTVDKGKHKGFHWTHGQKPQPFLDNAKNQHKDDISALIGGVK